MYSLELGRSVSFPRFGGTNLSPAWSPDGKLIVVSSTYKEADKEYWTVLGLDSATGAEQRLTPERWQ